MAGPEVHANAITTVLDGFPLRSAPGWVDLLVIVVLGVFGPLIAIRASACCSPSRWRSSQSSRSPSAPRSRSSTA